MLTVKIKVCSKCKKEKPLENFNRDNSTKDKLTRFCIACLKISHKKWIENNIDHIKKYTQEYRKTNKVSIKEKAKKYNKKFYKENINKIKEYQKKYYISNDIKVKKRGNDYRLKNLNNIKIKKKKDYIKIKKYTPWKLYLRYIKKRCNDNKSRNYKNYGRRGIRCLITEEELKQLWFRDKAYELTWASIDRKNNDGHYEYNNCRFIEMSENCRKGNKKYEI